MQDATTMKLTRAQERAMGLLAAWGRIAERDVRRGGDVSKVTARRLVALGLAEWVDASFGGRALSLVYVRRAA